ncbi:MAG: XRE family transcriptional regulator [Cytophagia bacterium]|nr:MAG: XRE family transcriptional regulator [Cytophagia bacterium]TAG40671.1 MAG: XRE family transcriptional regulator [Cytophagia bacterium]
MNTQKKIANRIRKIRELAEFTQEYVANKLEISQQQYSLLEKGESKITEERLDKIASILNTTPEKIQSFDAESGLFGKTYNRFQDSSTGDGNVHHIHQQINSKELKNVYELRIEEMHLLYESRILELKEEINRLVSILDKCLSK